METLQCMVQSVTICKTVDCLSPFPNSSKILRLWIGASLTYKLKASVFNNLGQTTVCVSTHA